MAVIRAGGWPEGLKPVTHRILTDSLGTIEEWFKGAEPERLDLKDVGQDRIPTTKHDKPD